MTVPFKHSEIARRRHFAAPPSASLSGPRSPCRGIMERMPRHGSSIVYRCIDCLDQVEVTEEEGFA